MQALGDLLQKRTIMGSELERLLEAREAKLLDFGLIDVREKHEHNFRYIEGTDYLLPFNSFYPKVKKLAIERAYILYCGNGSRSAMACDTMRDAGFTSASNLANGILCYGGKMFVRDS
ncbi:sulfurtransferase [Campylobacterota bacterium]|nr:sulfurtransferase [Campylobacterota bacterium]